MHGIGKKLHKDEKNLWENYFLLTISLLPGDNFAEKTTNTMKNKFEKENYEGKGTSLFSLKSDGRTSDSDLRVLEAALKAWQGWGEIRRRRRRNKDFTYGRQWGDIVKDDNGQPVTEGELVARCGKEPLTNNMLRQLIKCVVGRFRKSVADESKAVERALSRGKEKSGLRMFSPGCNVTSNDTVDRRAAAAYKLNCIEEIDARSLEELLISGCCVQRIDTGTEEPAGTEEGGKAKPHEGCVPLVDVPNVNRFFTNMMEDVRGNDCEIVGYLHDLHVSELIMRLAHGDAAESRRIREVYASLQSIYSSPEIGSDAERCESFWQAKGGKCRAIEVWTLELKEVLRCHDFKNRKAFTAPVEQLRELEAGNRDRRSRGEEEVVVNRRITKEWHCRWFAPDGTLLARYRSPYAHQSHPFAFRLYPLTDGEVHSFVEDVIDQQKYVNRLITVIDHIMNASAKGVLLFPESGLPEGFTWGDVRRLWSNADGIIPFTSDSSGTMPQQMVSRNADIGAYQLLDTQMKLIEDISGVNSALRGVAANNRTGVQLYETQLDNADTSLTDIYRTFDSFRAMRDAKVAALL